MQKTFINGVFMDGGHRGTQRNWCTGGPTTLFPRQWTEKVDEEKIAADREKPQDDGPVSNRGNDISPFSASNDDAV